MSLHLAHSRAETGAMCESHANDPHTPPLMIPLLRDRKAVTAGRCRSDGLCLEQCGTPSQESPPVGAPTSATSRPMEIFTDERSGNSRDGPNTIQIVGLDGHCPSTSEYEEPDPFIEPGFRYIEKSSQAVGLYCPPPEVGAPAFGSTVGDGWSGCCCS